LRLYNPHLTKTTKTRRISDTAKAKEENQNVIDISFVQPDASTNKFPSWYPTIGGIKNRINVAVVAHETIIIINIAEIFVKVFA
jgi:hypothetical protein